MATRQETNKPQEQQTKQPEQRAKQPQQPAQPQQPSQTETGLAPRRGGAPVAHPGWEPLFQLRDEFDRLLDQFSRGWLGTPAARWGVDMREDDNNVFVRAEAPGFEPSDFDIQVHGDQLVMRATRKDEEREEGGYRGWQRHDFYQALTLPTGVAADRVTAAYRQGVLTVTLPKSEDGRAKRITVSG
jgi:HSP20 family protein